jgi:hypothetical protein
MQYPRAEAQQGDRQRNSRNALRESRAFGLAVHRELGRIRIAVHQTMPF